VWPVDDRLAQKKCGELRVGENESVQGRTEKVGGSDQDQLFPVADADGAQHQGPKLPEGVQDTPAGHSGTC